MFAQFSRSYGDLTAEVVLDDMNEALAKAGEPTIDSLGVAFDVIAELLRLAVDAAGDEFKEGRQEGNQEGYDEGYEVGKDAGYEEGHGAGYGEGYDAGYGEGYAEGEEAAS